jgi:hypothetical protein
MLLLIFFSLLSLFLCLNVDVIGDVTLAPFKIEI